MAISNNSVENISMRNPNKIISLIKNDFCALISDKIVNCEKSSSIKTTLINSENNKIEPISEI